ncbi:MAG TPA: hypothetical protein VFA50_19605 [Stellaceae bacterium]|nr:hypothetical protein [Stellaceae bacterium]
MQFARLIPKEAPLLALKPAPRGCTTARRRAALGSELLRRPGLAPPAWSDLPDPERGAPGARASATQWMRDYIAGRTGFAPAASVPGMTVVTRAERPNAAEKRRRREADLRQLARALSDEDLALAIGQVRLLVKARERRRRPG